MCLFADSLKVTIQSVAHTDGRADEVAGGQADGIFFANLLHVGIIKLRQVRGGGRVALVVVHWPCTLGVYVDRYGWFHIHARR